MNRGLSLRRIARVALAAVVVVGLLSPCSVAAKRTAKKSARIVTYTVNFPVRRSGELAAAKPVLAALPELGFTGPGYCDEDVDMPRARRPVVEVEGLSLGSGACVILRGFWAREKPRRGEAPVRLTITDPEGRRAYVAIRRQVAEENFDGPSLIPDVFARGSDLARPVVVDTHFRFLLRPSYPVGRYSFVASAKNGRTARRSVVADVPTKPFGPIVYQSASPQEPIRLIWAGYEPGTPIGLLMYVRKAVDTPDRFAYEFFARFTAVPADANGLLEIAIPPEGAIPGVYCFVTDEPAPFGCGLNAVIVG